MHTPIELLAELSADEAAASALIGEMELRLGALLVRRGSLERAHEMLDSAAQRPLEAAGQRTLAEQWQRLARAWRTARKPDRAKTALGHAAELGSASAITAQALGVGREYDQLGQPERALATYVELVERAPTLANTLVVADRIDQLAPRLPEPRPNQQVRIALLGNATLDHLQSYLKVDCFRAGLRPIFYQAGFDQYSQELLAPNSGLYAFRPDVVICAIHASRLFPQLHHFPFDLSVAERRAEIDAGLQSLQGLLDAFTERSSAMVLLHNMVVPQHLALGILDSRDELGQSAAFAEINTRLAELGRSRYKSVYIVDEERVQARSGKATATDSRMWLTAHMAWSEPVLASLSREYMRFVRAARGLSRKCIVVDLDNTLWGGVIGEDGMSGIQLGSEAPGSAFVAFQRELEKLWRRGVLLAICSKNNPQDALPVFEQHPEMVLKLSHFAAQRINWEPKAANIAELARELNIGLDSLVFLDDNPVERAGVRAALPQVLTPELPSDPADYRRALLEIADVFDTLALTAEDRARNKLYAEERSRQAAQASVQAGGSLDDYLASLQIVVEIQPDTEVSLPRIAQLTTKTNQFNLTTRRYTEADILERKALGWRVFSARVGDRFGDNGLTGVAIVDPSQDGTWSIDTLLLSCRVMGRGVEAALLAHIVEEARRSGAQRLDGWYLPTPKNDVVRGLYSDHGFSLVEDADSGGTLWRLELSRSPIEVPAWLTVRSPSLVGTER